MQFDELLNLESKKIDRNLTLLLNCRTLETNQKYLKTLDKLISIYSRVELNILYRQNIDDIHYKTLVLNGTARLELILFLITCLNEENFTSARWGAKLNLLIENFHMHTKNELVLFQIIIKNLDKESLEALHTQLSTYKLNRESHVLSSLR